MFPTSEEKKNQLKYISNEVVRRRVTTQVQFTCLERSRRQILRRKFSARTPKGTRSVKISTKGICISVWWDAKAFPAHRSLFYIGGQTSRLNLFSSFLPGWRPTEFPREFSANIRLHPFIRWGRGYPDLASPKDELTRHSSDSFIRFLFESLIDDERVGNELRRFCATINMV